MPLQMRANPSFLAVCAAAALALFVAPALADDAQSQPSVQTYVDQAAPVPQPQATPLYNTPLQAGQMTLKDVLRIYPKGAPPRIPQSSLSATAPLLSPSSKASSADVMLQQGMESAVRAPGTGVTAKLKVPQVSPVAASAPPTSIAPPPGSQYQPGEEPKNLATGSSPTEVSSAPSSSETPKATEIAQAPAPLDEMPNTPSASSAPEKQASSDKNDEGDVNAAAAMRTASGPESVSAPAPAPTPVSATPCSPQTQSWTKGCAEAGYPASYSGKITGETRTVCPSGDLQDVWLENSCAPGTAKEAAAPVAETQVASAAQAAAETTSATTSAPATAETEASVDGSCGAANGLAANGKPATDLCMAGHASDIMGDGPWHWECKGRKGGMTVSCAAPVAAASAAAPAAAMKPSKALAAEDGKCGAANNGGLDQAPIADLCVKGTVSRVNGGGPWTWACSGANGGQAAACTAFKKVDGGCGVANGAGVEEMPMTDLCASGYASAVTGNGPWNWTCSGLYGGGAATCSAPAKKNAVCGSATLGGHRDAPHENLCSTGQPVGIEGNGPWNWTCSGVNGGASVACTAAISVNGTCGSANGVGIASTPMDQLCASGKASRVMGQGPWTWNCEGIEGGDTQGCTAPVLKAEVAPEFVSGEQSVTCGAAAGVVAMQAPDKGLCNGGSASALNGDGPWRWSCSDDAGHTAACATVAVVNGLCGTAANVTRAQVPPSEELCASGAASAVVSDKDSWTWNCAGTNGSTSVFCAAPRAPATQPAEESAVCGPATGRGLTAAPAEDLCSAGKPSRVNGNGPWRWTCIKGKQKMNCEAPKLVDAACGAANGSIQKYVPNKGLCAAGTSTEVAGNGPWLWTCVGAGGGVSTSCSAASQAQTRVDGSCGEASNKPATSMPAANLCDGGMPSNVYGEGPWTWTCSGLNGGIAASCATQKVVPRAPAAPGPAINGLCGPANGVASIAQPLEGLCSSGTATATSGDGPWNWDCLGQNSGMTVSCTAPLQPPAPITGACGAASGVPTLTKPQSGLCSAGIVSAVSGNGPWTWSCSGTNGGGAVGCVAPTATAGSKSALPSLSIAPETGNEAPAPQPAPSGLVTPRLPSGPLPPLENSGSNPTPPTFKEEAMPEAPRMPPPAEEEAAATTSAPASEPELPTATAPLMPPPVRDTIQPSPALKPPAIDAAGAVIPGNRFVLDSDVSVIAFAHGSENIDHDVLPTLDKLVSALQAHGNVRVTLTAYAGLDATTTPRDARRMSLARALAIRDYLTAKGISSGRIDVRALGANVVSGSSDRVDVRAN